VELWVPRPLSVRPGQSFCRLLALPQEDLPHKTSVSEWCQASQCNSCVMTAVSFALLSFMCAHVCASIFERALSCKRIVVITLWLSRHFLIHQQVNKNIFKAAPSFSHTGSSSSPECLPSTLEVNYRTILSKLCSKKGTDEEGNKKQKNKKAEPKADILDGKHVNCAEL